MKRYIASYYFGSVHLGTHYMDAVDDDAALDRVASIMEVDLRTTMASLDRIESFGVLSSVAIVSASPLTKGKPHEHMLQ